MNRITLASVLLLASVASAAAAAGRPECSIHPDKKASKAELAALAKIDQPTAEKAALASLGDAAKATVKESELEAEHGCLVYSFDLVIEGKKGVQEIHIDAGNGKVLASEHESARAEAKEKEEE